MPRYEYKDGDYTGKEILTEKEHSERQTAAATGGCLIAILLLILAIALIGFIILGFIIISISYFYRRKEGEKFWDYISRTIHYIEFQVVRPAYDRYRHSLWGIIYNLSSGYFLYNLTYISNYYTLNTEQSYIMNLFPVPSFSKIIDNLLIYVELNNTYIGSTLNNFILCIGLTLPFIFIKSWNKYKVFKRFSLLVFIIYFLPFFLFAVIFYT